MTQQIIEELIITPSDYPTRIDMSNPHPAANVKLGTFDVSTGAKISDENSWESATGIRSALAGNGFEFDCYRGFSASVYHSPEIRKIKVFDDGVFLSEYEYQGSGDWENIDIAKFDDGEKHRITVIHSEGSHFSIETIRPNPANLPVLTNPGTVADYPVLEVEPADTEALFSPLGKKVGDDTHPFEMAYFKTANPLENITPLATGYVPIQQFYDQVSFLDGDTFGVGTASAGYYANIRLKYDLKSPHFGMTTTEIKDHMQSILSELWGYARGTIEVGDPSFEAGVNGFDTNNGAVISQSAEWAKTGTKSLKIVADGTNQFAYTRKIYGNQAGEKITASLWVRNNESTPANIRVNWLDITSGASGSIVQTTIPAQTEIEITLPEYNVPADSQEVRLIIYPAFGVLEPATIYIDDVTVTACEIELYGWNGSWNYLYRGHENNYPALFAWINDTASLPSYINDGKVYFLVKSKYPSDGISLSTVYIDHCRLGTVMNYAKLGADAITNYGGNLLENGWGEYSATKGYPQGGSSFNQTLFNHEGAKLVYRGQQVTLSYEGWRDAEAIKNNIYPAILLLHYLNDGTYLGYTAPVSLFANIDANKWERKTVTTKLKDDPDIGIIKIYYYRAPSTTLPGKVGIQNAVLVAGDKIIYLGAQEKYIIGFTSEQTLTKDGILIIDGTALHVKKNDVSVVDSLSSTFSTNGFKLAPGLNHFKTSHIGGNMKIRVIKESMPKIAAFDGIYFPAVASIAKSKKKTGDKEETAGGKLRQDIVRVRRIWDVETGKLTKEEADELIDHLESKLYGSGDFWLAEFGGGGNTIEAYIDPNNLKEEIVPFGKDGWHPDGRRLSFRVEER